MRRAWALVPTALLLAACGSGGPSSNHAEPSPTGRSTPAHLPIVVDQSAVSRRIAGGTPTVLLFMATGCASCVEQAKALTSAAQGRRDVDIVGIDLLSEDDGAALSGFVRDAELGSLPITWTIDRDGSIEKRFQVQRLDEMIGLVRGGIQFHDGPDTDAAQLRQQIQGLT